MGNLFGKGGVVTLRGHQQVTNVRFLSGGDLVTTGDCTVRLWNVKTMKAEKIWKLSGDVETCCCSPDGAHIACGVPDGLIVVFDARSRQQVCSWQAHSDCGQGPLLQFFTDSAYLLTAAGPVARIWGIRGPRLFNSWEGADATCMHMSGDCTLVAMGSPSGIVTVHKLPDGYVQHRIHAHRTAVWSVAFSSNGELLATGARDDPEGIKLWITDDWSLAHVLRGHASVVLDLSFGADGLQLVSCGIDRTLRIWGARRNAAARIEWRCEQVLQGHDDAVLSCSYAPAHTPGIVASGSRDGTARVWRLSEVPQASDPNIIAG